MGSRPSMLSINAQVLPRMLLARLIVPQYRTGKRKAYLSLSDWRSVFYHVATVATYRQAWWASIVIFFFLNCHETRIILCSYCKLTNFESLKSLILSY